jgi:hypothetical protein
LFIPGIASRTFVIRQSLGQPPDTLLTFQRPGLELQNHGGFT